MARRRIIKPDFFINEELPQVSAHARLLFIALWTLADRRGLLEDRPKRIKLQSFPYENVDVDALLGELTAAGFIARYEAEGRRCIHVITFERHQNPHQNEPDSDLPPPPEGLSPMSQVVAPAEQVASPKSPAHGQSGSGSGSGPDQGPDPVRVTPAPARSYAPEMGTIYWLRGIYRGPWEEKYSGRQFGSTKGEKTAWENHLTENPDPAYRAQLFAEAPLLLRAYLDDDDEELRARMHTLAFFPERIPKYRAKAARSRASPPRRSGSEIMDEADSLR